MLRPALPEREAGVLQQDAIIFRDLLGDVRQKWYVETTEASFITRCVDPGIVSVLGVHGAGDHFCVDLLKVFHSIAEGQDLSWTDKCAVWRGKC